MRKIIFVILIAVALTGCGQRRNKARKSDSAKQETVKKVLTPEEDSLYKVSLEELMLVDYWDRFDYENPLFVLDRNLTMQAFESFVGMALRAKTPQVIDRAVDSMLTKAGRASEQLYNDFVMYSDAYLYNPNSPYRSDEIYIPILERVIANPKYDANKKVRLRARLEMAKKNRVGIRANDFTFTLDSGKTGTLYGIEADYTLLFFYNLGCAMCADVRNDLTKLLNEDPAMKQLFDSGKLKILALYPDKDIAGWDKYKADIPSAWINAYDRNQTINSKKLYDLKAIPSLYLLDKDKKVLEKDFVIPERIPYALGLR